MNSLQASEKECAAVAVAPRVSLSDIEGAIEAVYHAPANALAHATGLQSPPALEVLSICLVVMRNGFTIVGKSAPASPENFNRDLGQKLAYEDCIRQIWPLMGFALRDKLGGRCINISDIARVCHEVNRAYCASQGDHTQPLWQDAPEWQRSSAIAGVRFTLAHPYAKPSDSHESWLEEKRRDGWQYGPVKDPERKLHPCFVPYDELPPAQKAKDYLFQAVVRALT